ncbi:MAG: hypothetical protein LBC75_05440 [Fibromonadaceae bacterium]|jgi:hypothetical protein|nr:hypothetical protein [Fibromonadaceae bacterium]
MITIEKYTIKWSKPVAINLKANGEIEFDAKEPCWETYYGFFMISVDTIETDQLLCIGEAYDRKIRECVFKKYKEIHGSKILSKDKKYNVQAGIIASEHKKPDGSEESKKFFHDILSLLTFDNWNHLYLNVDKSMGKYEGRHLKITNENCSLVREKSSSPSVVASKLFELFKVKKIKKGGSLSSNDVKNLLKEYGKEHIDNAIDYLEEREFVEKEEIKNGFKLNLLVRRDKSFDNLEEEIEETVKKIMIRRS